MSVYRVNYSSEALCRNVELNVIVPFESPGMPELLETKPKKFKTLYLLHGFGGNQNDWLDYTEIRDIAEQNNLAVVMPAGENSWYVDTGVFASQYGNYFGKELVEYTRKAFPLSCKREDTFVGGFSMGGFGALRLGSFYHELYSKVFAFSGAFIIDDIAGAKPGYKDDIADYDYYVRTFGDLEHLKNTDKDPLWCLDEAIKAKEAPELYIACGTDDFLIRENRQMKAELDKRDVKLTYVETKGIHDWVFWREQIIPAVAWCLK